MRIQISIARERGIDFLRRCATDQPAAWTDFRTRTSGVGGDWITAYTLAHCGSEFQKESKVFADYLIRSSGKVGYNSIVPPDSDSSSWGGIVLARESTRETARTRIALSEFLYRHWLEGASIGISTYEPNSKIKQYKGSNGNWVDFRGWTSTACDDITASAFLSLVENGMLDGWFPKCENWLRAVVARGHVTSYWWPCATYSVRMVAEALMVLERSVPHLARLCETTRCVVRKQLASFECENLRTPFDIANYLSALLLTRTEVTPAPGVALGALDRILRQQHGDGSWRSNDVMRIPRPDDTAPWNSSYFSSERQGTGGLLSDSGVLTTATVCKALSLSQTLGESK